MPTKKFSQFDAFADPALSDQLVGIADSTDDNARWTVGDIKAKVLADAGAFATVAAMKASTHLKEGMYVQTLGYLAPGDGGAALYEVVASASADDGGLIHELQDPDLRASLVHEGHIAAEQFGAVSGIEASAQIQAAWDAVADWQVANDRYATFTHSSNVTIQNQVKFRNTDSSVARNINIDMSRATWTATTGGDLSTTVAVLLCRATRSTVRFGVIDGNKLVAGLDIFAATSGRLHEPEVRHFKGFGIKVRGALGSMCMYNPIATEYDQEDVEYTTQGNYTALGMWVQDGDWTCFGGNILFCYRPLYIDAETVQVHFVNCHFVNGNADFPDSAAWVNPVIIENHATRENHFEGCYFDNGLILDYECTMNIVGGHYVNNGAATLTNPHIRLYANAAAQDSAPDIRITDLGGLASVGFVDNGGETWDGDLTGFSDNYAEMEDEDKTVQVRQTEFNLYPNDQNKVEHNIKFAGDFRYTHTIGPDSVTQAIDPTTGERKFSGESVAWANRGGTTRWSMETADSPYALVPATDSVGNIGSQALRVNQVNAREVITGQNLRYSKWRKAVANMRAGAARAKLMVISDSTGMGAGAGTGGDFLIDAYAKAWPARMATFLTERGFKVYDQSFWTDQGQSTISMASYDPRITLGANWSFSATTLGGSMLKYTDGAVNNFSFTPEAAFDKIEIYAYDNNGGSFATNVDGGASLGTITTNGGTQTIVKTTYTVSDATHTINLVPSDNGDFFILGIVTYRSTVPGVDLIRACRSGSTSTDFINTALPFRPGNVIPQIDPDLTIVALTINDTEAPTGAPTYKTQMQTLITNLKAGGDVMLMTGPPQNTTSGGDGTLLTYTDKLEELAYENEVDFLRIGGTRVQSRWKLYSDISSLFPYSEPRHPGELGYWDIGAAAAEAVLKTR